MRMTKALHGWLTQRCRIEAGTSEKEALRAAGRALLDGSMTAGEFILLTNEGGNQMARERTTPYHLFAGGGGHSGGRVGRAAGTYSSAKSVGVHPKTGKAVFDEIYQAPAETTSELERAKLGVFLRGLAMKSPGRPAIRPFDAHEQALWDGILTEDPWVGSFTEQEEAKAYQPGWTKADILSDAISGGSALNPLWYDTLLTTYPLLHGELFPFVRVVDMPRSATINTAAIDNPTVVWGEVEGTPLTPFDASNLITPITATVTNVMVAVKVGLDLLSDVSPIVLGDYLTANIGQRMQQELDRVIAAGNGTTEPLGILNTSGMRAVNSDLGAGGPPTVGDYEGLLFSLPKQYRNEGESPAFVASDISYRRVRGIPVGPGDERRIFGLNEQSYTVLDEPYRVVNATNANNTPAVPNSSIVFGALKRYRLWRRLGFYTRWVWEGQTLALANEGLLVIRGRFAGKVQDPRGFSLMSDAQA
jgi:HK97 family phage major capsid protein